MSNGRFNSGVKKRLRGQGSWFGNLHREKLPGPHYMADLDAMITNSGEPLDTENRVFSEFTMFGRPAQYATVAILDLKRSREDVDRARRGVIEGVLLHHCRSLSRDQGPPPCKFFYVVGSWGETLVFLEVDIHTGEPLRDPITVSPDDDWEDAYIVLGITPARQAHTRRLMGHP